MVSLPQDNQEDPTLDDVPAEEVFAFT